MMEYIHLLDATLEHQNQRQSVTLQSIIGEEWEYTGNYRAIINGTSTTEFSIDENTLWIEKGKGHTELAKKLGSLIENYFE